MVSQVAVRPRGVDLLRAMPQRVGEDALKPQKVGLRQAKLRVVSRAEVRPRVVDLLRAMPQRVGEAGAKPQKVGLRQAMPRAVGRAGVRPRGVALLRAMPQRVGEAGVKPPVADQPKESLLVVSLPQALAAKAVEHSTYRRAFFESSSSNTVKCLGTVYSLEVERAHRLGHVRVEETRHCLRHKHLAG